ncbi:integrase core domain-containing protein, partial [Pantoea endophytica]
VNDLPDAVTVLEKLTEWMEDYNNWHPHKGLKLQSPGEYRSSLLVMN